MRETPGFTHKQRRIWLDLPNFGVNSPFTLFSFVLDGRLYCRQCYSKKYGPQTRSSGIDHKLIDTSIIKSADEKNNCPRYYVAFSFGNVDFIYMTYYRCGGAVFKAEEIYSAGKSYHRKCATCITCAKKLDFNTIYDGGDGDIYCKSCYSRKFAPAGTYMRGYDAHAMHHAYLTRRRSLRRLSRHWLLRVAGRRGQRHLEALLPSVLKSTTDRFLHAS